MSIRTRDHQQEKNVKKTSEMRPPVDKLTKIGAHNFKYVMQKKTVVLKSFTPLLIKPAQKKIKPEIKNDVVTAKPESDDNKSSMPLPVDKHEHQSPSSATSHYSVERVSERDGSVMAQTAIASGRADDINQLIKKLTLNFSANKRAAQFSISSGVFAGAHFFVATDERDLTLTVNNASREAQWLLKTHQTELKKYLAAREINLRSLSLLS